MRAIRYRNGQVWLDEGAPEARAGADEAIVRVVRCGVSEADVAVCRGSVAFEGVLGHELVGVVEAFGEGVSGADRERWLRRRVVASPDVVCGRCDLCRAGLSAHCRERRVMGLSGRDGCLAERVGVPLRNLVAIPEGVSDDAAVFAGALGVGLHAAQLVRLEGKAYVTVLGDGVVALLCAQVMQRLNASVRVLGDQPGRFARCERWGIRHRHVDEAGRRQDQDVVVDCMGTASSLAIATGLVRPRAKILLVSATGLAGADDEHGGADLAPIVANELELLGARGGSVADGVRALASGQADVLSLISRRMRLGDGVGALRAAAEPDQLKVMVES